MIQPPCKECTKRKLGCHSGCEDYNKYKQAREEISARRRQENDISYTIAKGHPVRKKAAAQEGSKPRHR